LSQTTVNTWATLTKGTEHLIAIQLVREHESGQFFFISCTKTILNGYIIVILR